MKAWRRNVSFLGGVRPHPNTRTIVSMLSDDDDDYDDEATSTMTKEGGNNECGWPRSLCEMKRCTEGDDSILSVEEPKNWRSPSTRMKNDHVPTTTLVPYFYFYKEVKSSILCLLVC